MEKKRLQRFRFGAQKPGWLLAGRADHKRQPVVIDTPEIVPIPPASVSQIAGPTDGTKSSSWLLRSIMRKVVPDYI